MTIPCDKEVEIDRLKNSGENMLHVLREMSADLKAMRSAMEAVSALSIKHENHQEALDRAFARVEVLEREALVNGKFVVKVESMARMAWWIWSVFAGGLGLVLLKIFHIVGA